MSGSGFGRTHVVDPAPMAATAREPERDRFLGIDFGRYVAFVAVVLLHTLTISTIADRPSILGLIDHASRFAVPFFFIVSGFFTAGRSLGTWNAIRKIALRLLPVYLFWVAVYALLSGEPSVYFSSPATTLRTLANGGAGYHLWFLPSLGIGMCGVLLARKYLGDKGIVAIGLLLYAAGLSLGSYRMALGIPGDQSRAGPLFAFGFIALGFWMRDRQIVPSAKAAVGLAAVGLTVQMAEALFLSAHGYGSFAPHNFLIGTVPFGLGIFAICAHVHANGSAGHTVAALGQKSFGMYCIHVLFIWLSTWMLMPADPVRWIAVSVAVVICSTAVIVPLANVRPLRRLIQ